MAARRGFEAQGFLLCAMVRRHCLRVIALKRIKIIHFKGEKKDLEGQGGVGRGRIDQSDPGPLPLLHSQQLRHGAGPQLLFQNTLDPGQLPVDGAGGFGQVFAVEIRLEAVGEKKFFIRGPDHVVERHVR